MKDRNGNEMKVGDTVEIVDCSKSFQDHLQGQIREYSENTGRIRIARGPDSNLDWQIWLEPHEVFLAIVGEK